MRSIILLFVLSIIGISSCTSTSKIPNELQLQEQFLFKELIEQELYLGLSKAELLIKRPKAESNTDGFGFREIYIDTAFSQRFNTVIYYIDKDGSKPVYEFILLVDDGLDATKIATQKYGKPNHNQEWRFTSETTSLPFDIAVWTFRNKVIIAGTIANTEWADGIE